MNRLTLLAFCMLIAYMATADENRYSGTDPEEKGLGVVYAQLKLELAEVKLKSAEMRNDQIRGAVAGYVVEQRRDDVELSRQELSQAEAEAVAEAEGVADPFGNDLRRARVEAKAAVTNWRNAMKAINREPRLFSALHLRILELQAEVAQINYEQGKAVAESSPEVKLRWQLRFLQDRMERLNDEVFRKPRPAVRWHRWQLSNQFPRAPRWPMSF